MALFGAPAVQGGREESETAWFPTSGLVALYKCDETAGDRLYDATGNLPPIVMSTGIALDCVAANLYVDDTTFRDEVVGTGSTAGIAVMGCEIITPAAGAGTQSVVGRNGNDGTMELYLSEASSKYRLYAAVRTTRDGTTTAVTTINSGSGFQLEPSTHYQVVVRIDMASATPSATFSVRSAVSGAWRTLTVSGGTAGVHVFASSNNVRVLAVTAAGQPFEGKVLSVFAGAKDLTIQQCRNLISYPGIEYVQSVLGTTHARYWLFNAGSAAYVRELVKDTWVAIAGTVAWTTGLSGCTQPSLRQGNPYLGKFGVKVGGEASFPGSGSGGISAAAAGQVLTSDGWTLQATVRVGARDPASEQIIVYVHGPLTTGSDGAIGAMAGAGFSLNTSQTILAGAKKHAATDVSAVISAQIGESTQKNGVLQTLTMTCSWNGTNWIVSGYRQVHGDASPTLVTPHASWGTNDYNITRANKVQIGNASFDTDIVVGFVGIWHRVLTTAEMAHCHNQAIVRMDGEPIYIADANPGYGNGSQTAPYAGILPALRVFQPTTTMYVGSGDYDYINTASTTVGPSVNGVVTVSAQTPATRPVFRGDAAARVPKPTYINAGSWTFNDIIFDGRDVNDWSFHVQDGAERITLNNCKFMRAKQDPVDTATGTGASFRNTPLVEINDCQADGNEEHGVYLRVYGEVANCRAVVKGLVVTDCGEDGLKFSSEGAPGVSWANCIVDRVKVTGGKSQLWLSGISDSVVSNCLLIDQTLDSIVGAIHLGYYAAEAGEDGCDNVTVVNTTVVNSAAPAIRDANSTGTVFKNLVCKDCTEDFTQLTDGTAVVMNSAGDAATDPFPAGDGNIPGATIAFTDTGTGDYSLTAGSDGTGDGVNLTGLSNEAEVMFDGTTRRPSTGAWNMGAY